MSNPIDNKRLFKERRGVLKSIAIGSAGVTYAMVYSDGCQLYLPTSAMLDEGGYEVESYWEYRQPAPLAKGLEKILTATLGQLRDRGIA